MQQEPVERARRGDHDAFAVLASAPIDATEPLQSFVRQPTIRLTSFRRDGRPVGTAVSIVVDGSLGYVRTYESSGKVKRIRNNPLVDIAPSTLTGSATGATTVSGPGSSQAEHARRLINRRYPWLHAIMVPLAHRLTGKKTVYLELTPVVSSSVESALATDRA